MIGPHDHNFATKFIFKINISTNLNTSYFHIESLPAMSISLLFSLLGPGLPLILDKKFCIAMLSSRLGNGFTPSYPKPSQDTK